MNRRLFSVAIVVVALAAVWPSDALAQRGRGGGGGRGPAVVIAPQRTVVYPPWYGPFGPYGGGYGYPGQYPYPYPYPYRGYNDSADLRLQVTPRETEVFVDGAKAGIVDDYDGIFQRLHLTPGDHEITLYLAGFRTWSERRYFSPRADQRILHTMLQLAPGQPDEPRPVPQPQPMERMAPRRLPGDAGDLAQPGQPRNPPPDRPAAPRAPQPPNPPNPPAEPRMPAPPDRPANEPRNFGTLSVGIQPADAEVLLDGQKQSLPSGQERLIIQLPEGVHRLVIQKSGFSPYETDLQIRRGRTLAFNVSLVK